MEPIYNSQGKAVGWLTGERIMNISGLHIAFVKNGAVYSYRNGVNVGRFDHGFFRDNRGNAVSFIKGATNGPLLPMMSIPPVPPVPAVPPVLPIPQVPHLPAHPTLSWSAIGWDQFTTM